MTSRPRQKERRQFSREFKLAAIQRMEEAGNVSALADELGVRRELLYDWREKFAAGGAEALKGSGRPRPPAESPEARDGRPFVPTFVLSVRFVVERLFPLASHGRPANTPLTLAL